MTDEEFKAWLKSPAAIRCILVEVSVKLSNGMVATRYLSTRGYVTKPSETPANTTYQAVIAGGVKFTQSMSLDGSVSLAFGDIELNNTDGKLDAWLDDYWTNRSIAVYIGDATWPRVDFRKIFDGTTLGIDTRKRDRINVKLSDKLQRLNTPVSDDKLGGLSTNADRLLPLCFGECHNIEPLLVDSSAHEYQVHNGPIERIIEVRDNGVPVEFTPFVASGKFKLLRSPVGQVTASVQGDKPDNYANDAVSIIQRLVTAFGSDTTRFLTTDLDVVAMNDLRANNPQPLGLYLNERTNVLEACNRVAGSIGARLVITSSGLLSLVKLSLPQTGGTTVTNVDMEDRSLEITSLPAVKAGVKIGYCKNWTVQTNLATGLVEEHRTMFSEEWLSTTRTNSLAAANFNLFTEPELEETLLLTAADAIAEADRRLSLFSVQRKVFRYKGFSNLLLEELGKPQTIQHSRFGLSSGVTGQIISMTTDWIGQRVEIEVLI